MRRAYDEIMEHIKVTPEMGRRVLQRVEEEDLSSPAKVLLFPALKRYLPVAACLVLLLAGALVLPDLMGPGEPEPPPVLVGSGIEKAASLRELSGLVGFEVTEDLSLPFEAAETAYFSYWNELAEVQYTGAGQSAAFRKSPGTGDNSGDYSEYEDVVTVTASGCPVTLKGKDGAYALAVWTKDGYAYSLRLSQAAAEADWLVILGGL